MITLNSRLSHSPFLASGNLQQNNIVKYKLGQFALLKDSFASQSTFPITKALHFSSWVTKIFGYFRPVVDAENANVKLPEPKKLSSTEITDFCLADFKMRTNILLETIDKMTSHDGKAPAKPIPNVQKSFYAEACVDLGEEHLRQNNRDIAKTLFAAAVDLWSDVIKLEPLDKIDYNTLTSNRALRMVVTSYKLATFLSQKGEHERAGNFMHYGAAIDKAMWKTSDILEKVTAKVYETN